MPPLSISMRELAEMLRIVHKSIRKVTKQL